jgi:hypothetical protein
MMNTGPRFESVTTLAGRFQLLRELGSGGYGVVYEALDLTWGTRVALKTLQRMDPDALLRFKEEFRALQEVEHSNLVQLYELICADGLWFFTMELLRGTDFIDFVRTQHEAFSYLRARTLDEARLRRALVQLLHALQAVHESGRRAGLEDVIAFPGVVAGEAKLALLRSSDVLVFPGIQNEGQPYVILEAMAAALPVVSTAKGAIEDMVVDGVNGCIVPDRAPSAIADVLLKLEADPAVRRRPGEAGRRRYLERFTDERTIEALVDWLARVERGGAPSPASEPETRVEIAR